MIEYCTNTAKHRLNKKRKRLVGESGRLVGAMAGIAADMVAHMMWLWWRDEKRNEEITTQWVDWGCSLLSPRVSLWDSGAKVGSLSAGDGEKDEAYQRPFSLQWPRSSEIQQGSICICICDGRGCLF